MAERDFDTVGYYERNAERFASNTRGLDTSALHERFLRHVPPEGWILDAGCANGRDARAFAERGYSVLAFDASAELVRLAREHVGGQAEVQHKRFEEVAWREEFDGVWACASLLHVPLADFRAIARRLAAALRPGGACYMSFKYGVGERVSGDRHFTDNAERSLRAAVRDTRFDLSETWMTNDVRAGRSGERWLNAIANAAA